MAQPLGPPLPPTVLSIGIAMAVAKTGWAVGRAEPVVSWQRLELPQESFQGISGM